MILSYNWARKLTAASNDATTTLNPLRENNLLKNFRIQIQLMFNLPI